MKKNIVLYVICSYGLIAFAGLSFNDNGYYTVSYEVEGDGNLLVDVDNYLSSAEDHTTVRLIDGAAISSAIVQGYGQLIIEDGIINSGIIARHNSHIIINGGSYLGQYSDRNFYDNSLLEVYGGDLTDYGFTSFGGDIRIYGYDFTITEQDYGHGAIWYTFNGTLANGDVVADLVVVGLPEDVSFIEVPEPATLAMLGLGGFLIRRRRKA